jgi:hypothetical protein
MGSFSIVHPVTTSADLPPKCPPGGKLVSVSFQDSLAASFAVSPIWGGGGHHWALGPGCEVPRWPGCVECGRRGPRPGGVICCGGRCGRPSRGSGCRAGG